MKLILLIKQSYALNAFMCEMEQFANEVGALTTSPSAICTWNCSLTDFLLSF